MKRTVCVLALSVLAFGSVQTLAEDVKSVYSKLDFDKSCTFGDTSDMGGTAICKGLGEYKVHFAEGDLRQMVQFGYVSQAFEPWQSFSEFNRVNETIEWRLHDGKPVATILRWFIENFDENSGQPSKRREGQVLVVSSVGTPEKPESCIIGYVDARENREANLIAAEIADRLSGGFSCEKDEPRFHGKRGSLSGNPSVLAR